MAYDKEIIYNQVLEVIEKEKLKYFDYIQGFIQPCTKTLYDLFPVESNEFHTIKKALENNAIASKNKLLNKWESSEIPALQIAAFKLMATNEERKALSTNWNESKHSFDETKPQINISVDGKDLTLK